MFQIEVKCLNDDNICTLAEIERRAFLPLYEKYKDESCLCKNAEADMVNRLADTSAHCFTVFCGGEAVGGVFYKSEGSSLFFESLSKGEYYLNRAFLSPSLQGKGIISSAILMCEKYFPDAKRFFVDFPEDLEKNRRCYEKAGYSDTGKRYQVKDGLVLALYEKRL